MQKESEMKKLILIIAQIVMVASLSGCGLRVPATPTPTAMPTPCVGSTITLGEISDDPGQVIRNTQSIANYLAKHLAAFGYVCGKVRVVSNVKEMISAVEQGQVDVYWDSLFPAAMVSEVTGARPILRRWRNCDPDYYSVLFTQKDNGINTINDLPGHMIAMDRPDSTSGFVLPAAYLLDHGLTLVVKEAYDAPVAKNEVGITFTYDDQNTIALVLAGKVSAGATDDYLYNMWGAQPEKELVMLEQTSPALRQAVLLRPNLESSLQAAIQQILLNANQDPEGAKALEEAAHTCKFDEVPDVIETAFADMHTMHAKVETIQGWSEAMEQ